jgi:hypothetical protein
MRVTETHDYDVIGELIDAPAVEPVRAPNPFPILAAPRPQTAPLAR